MLQDAAESLGITISDAVSGALASDVEYRIHQVIEVTIDIDNSIIMFLNACRKLHVSCAMDDEQHLQHLTSTMHSGLSILNLFMGISRFLSHHIEKLCHFLKFSTPGTSQPTTGPVYFVEDEEVDFERVLREEKSCFQKASVGPHIGSLLKVFSP